MTIYKIMLEGQEIPVPEEIGATDAMVKKALQPAFPEVANAAITRVTKGDEVIITVVKRAGSKGGWKDLITAPEGRNPVITYYHKVKDLNPVQLSPEEILNLDVEINEVLDEGSRQEKTREYAFRRLVAAKAQPSTSVPLGF